MGDNINPKDGPSEERIKERMESMGFTVPPLKDMTEMTEEGLNEQLPPPVRSIMMLTNNMVTQVTLRAKIFTGFQASIMYEGRPYCYASGFRDGSRGIDPEDKGNAMKVKDPLLLGPLTTPLTALLALQLHDKKSFGLETPLTQFLPELPDSYDRLTARDILARRVTVDDAKIYEACGAKIPSLFVPDRVTAFQDNVWTPVRKYFGEAGGSPPEQTRRHLCEFIRTSKSLPPPRRIHVRTNPFRIPMSHFSMALLAAAIERQMQKPFEDVIHDVVFKELQAHSCDFGPPKQYRDSSELFYVPRGLASGHTGFATPVPIGDVKNVAPTLFNASLNAHIPVENAGGLIQTMCDTIKTSTEKLPGKLNQHHYWELGLLHRPPRKQMVLPTNHFTGNDFLPFAGSLFYDTANDLGGHCVVNTGSRAARFWCNVVPKFQSTLFLHQIIKKGAQLHTPVEKQTDVSKKVHEEFEKEEEKNLELNKKYNIYQRRSFERY